MSWGLAEASISLSGQRSSHGTVADCGRNSYLRPFRDNERIFAGMKLAFLPTQVSSEVGRANGPCDGCV